MHASVGLNIKAINILCTVDEYLGYILYYIVRRNRGRCVRGMVPGGGRGRAPGPGRGSATSPSSLDN